MTRPGFQIGAVMTAKIEVPRRDLGKISVSGLSITRSQGGSLWLRCDQEGWLPSDDELERELASWGIVGIRPNAFTNLGLHYVLDRIFNLNTPATSISHMGISADTTAASASTLAIDPAPTTSTNIKALGTGTGAVAASRTAETVSCSAGWTKADANFVIAKVGLFNTSTDAADDTVPTVQGVLNIIGGTGGTSPYNEVLSIDLTGASSFNLTLQQDVTAQAT